jgi:4-hydroxybenzoate polyprenyltransferase
VNLSASPVASLWRLSRPSHWVKNIFVLAGVFFGEDWRSPEFFLLALSAFAAFCLASSAVYAINDVLDLEEDRTHPLKRFRPLASGALSPATAFAFAAGLAAGALAISLWTGPKLSTALIAYMLVNVLYSRLLKHMVLVDVFCIAFGFIIRLLAGTWGIGIEPSQWFLLCTMALSLFLGFSKRYAERMDTHRPLEKKRPVLQSYSPEFLRVLLGVTLSATLITYGLYTTNTQTMEFHRTGKLIYTLPIAMFGLFRYLYLVMEKGYGENTVADLLKDRTMLLICAIYVTCVAFLLIA